MTTCGHRDARYGCATCVEDARSRFPRFPLQVTRHPKVKPGPASIPWAVAERAYAAYAQQYGTSQSLERLAERGGFGWSEMDMLLPEWRALTDEWQVLAKENAELKAEVARLKAAPVHPHLAPQPSPAAGTARPTWEGIVEELRARAAETDGEESRGWALMADDGRARDAFGAGKYGRRHQADNGRDHAVDAYQEHLDGFMYWRAEAHVAHLTGDEARATEAWALYKEALRFAHRARLYLLRRDGR